MKFEPDVIVGLGGRMFPASGSFVAYDRRNFHDLQERLIWLRAAEMTQHEIH